MNSHEIFAVGVANNRAEYRYLHSGTPRTSTAFDLKEKTDILVFGMQFDYYKNGKIYRNDKLVPEQTGMLNKAQIKTEFESLYNTNSLTPVWNKFYRRTLIS